MKCEIIWNSLSPLDWQTRFDAIKHSNILQSYEYAIATCRLNKQSARWGLIKIDGVEAGLVQLIEARFLGTLFHGVILDRGPLWFDGFGSAVHVASFFELFNKLFPKRLGRRRRIIPEIELSTSAQKILGQSGLNLKEEPPYQTLWWDISQNKDDLRQNLSKSWEKSLKKAQKSDLDIVWDDKLSFYSEFKTKYLLDKQNKAYENVSPKLLDNLASLSTKGKSIVIGKAIKDGRCVAGVLFIKHGSCATYQIGWTSDEGRKYCAHHALLWKAKFMYDAYGIQTLDLGGINDHETGITKFKKGTGAIPITLIGQYD